MKLIHRLLRKPFFGRFEVPWVWPRSAVETAWERVAFRNDDGARLVGESEPSSFDYPADILAAGLWAQEKQPALSVGLVGASFGAGWGLCSMSRTGNPFRAAVLEATFATLPEFWRHYRAAYAVLRASQWLWPSIEESLRPEREAARVVGQPSVLLIYGDSDDYTPPAHGERLRRAFGGRAQTELLVLPGVGHTYAYRDARDAYAERVIPFLRATLARQAAGRGMA